MHDVRVDWGLLRSLSGDPESVESDPSVEDGWQADVRDDADIYGAQRPIGESFMGRSAPYEESPADIYGAQRPIRGDQYGAQRPINGQYGAQRPTILIQGRAPAVPGPFSQSDPSEGVARRPISHTIAVGISGQHPNAVAAVIQAMPKAMVRNPLQIRPLVGAALGEQMAAGSQTADEAAAAIVAGLSAYLSSDEARREGGRFRMSAKSFLEAGAWMCDPAVWSRGESSNGTPGTDELDQIMRGG